MHRSRVTGGLHQMNGTTRNTMDGQPMNAPAETSMKVILAALFVALMALTGVTATAHAASGAAPDRVTVTGNEAG